MDESNTQKTSCKQWLLLAGILVILLVILLAGLRRDLPYAVHVDEIIYVSLSDHMITSGNMNPGWFGNPGSTVIYPLTFAYFFMHKFAPDIAPFYFLGTMLTHVQAGMASYFYIGRILTILYTLITFPLIFLIGRRAFNTNVGLLATLFTTFYAVLIYHGQIVRTDSAATFWGCLAVWLCLETYCKPRGWMFLLTGLAIGSAIATRYFMVVLIPIAGLLALYLLWINRGQKEFKKLIGLAILGMIGIGLGFVLWTPYFFFDFDTAVTNILSEARNEHTGADGFSPLGNLWWYLSHAIFIDLGWVQLLFATIGIVAIVWKRKFLPILLLTYVILFLLTTSSSGLHWARWIIQILPIIALFVAYGFVITLETLQSRLSLSKSVYTVLFAVLLLVTLWHSANKTIRMDVRLVRLSTNVLAREWMVAHLPEESKIIEGWYTAPLAATSFVVTESNPIEIYTWEEYKLDGYDYMVVSTGMYGNYYNEPDRYAEQIQYYEKLFSEGILLQEFPASDWRAGPAIQIYQLPEIE